MRTLLLLGGLGLALVAAGAWWMHGADFDDLPEWRRTQVLASTAKAYRAENPGARIEVGADKRSLLWVSRHDRATSAIMKAHVEHDPDSHVTVACSGMLDVMSGRGVAVHRRMQSLDGETLLDKRLEPGDCVGVPSTLDTKYMDMHEAFRRDYLEALAVVVEALQVEGTWQDVKVVANHDRASLYVTLTYPKAISKAKRKMAAAKMGSFFHCNAETASITDHGITLTTEVVDARRMRISRLDCPSTYEAGSVAAGQ